MNIYEENSACNFQVQSEWTLVAFYSLYKLLVKGFIKGNSAVTVLLGINSMKLSCGITEAEGHVCFVSGLYVTVFGKRDQLRKIINVQELVKTFVFFYWPTSSFYSYTRTKFDWLKPFVRDQAHCKKTAIFTTPNDNPNVFKFSN